MDGTLQELQEDLIEYFKDTSDLLFVLVVDSLVFHKTVGPEDSNGREVSFLCSKFLKDQGIEEEYLEYVQIIKSGKKPLMLTSPAKVNVIEQLKSCLLALSHNRFRNYV